MAWNLVDTATERSPADLYEACARDDASAIDEFVRRYQPELAGYARRHGAEDPEGMANLATFDTVRRLAGMRSTEEPAVRAYLYRALKGRLIDERRAAVPEVSIDGLGVELATDGPESPVLDQLEFTEMLDLLTPAEREVVSHRFVAGYTSVETAARVGRSPDAVRRLQSNAIARLRLALAAALLVAAGAGYWFISSNQTVRTTEPINGPTDQQVPDSSRRSTGQSPSTPGPARPLSSTGDIIGSDPAASPTDPGDGRPTTSSTTATTEASTTSEGPEPSADDPSEQGQTGLAPQAATGVTTPATSGPAASTPAASTPAPPTSANPTTTPPTAGPTPTTAPPSTISSTGPPTTSGDSAETTTTDASDEPGDRGKGRGRGRGPGQGEPGDRSDDPPGQGGGHGRGGPGRDGGNPGPG